MRACKACASWTDTVAALKASHDRLREENERLRSEVSRLSGVEYDLKQVVRFKGTLEEGSADLRLAAARRVADLRARLEKAEAVAEAAREVASVSPSNVPEHVHGGLRRALDAYDAAKGGEK